MFPLSFELCFFVRLIPFLKILLWSWKIDEILKQLGFGQELNSYLFFFFYGCQSLDTVGSRMWVLAFFMED